MCGTDTILSLRRRGGGYEMLEAMKCLQHFLKAVKCLEAVKCVHHFLKVVKCFEAVKCVQHF